MKTSFVIALLVLTLTAACTTSNSNMPAVTTENPLATLTTAEEMTFESDLIESGDSMEIKSTPMVEMSEPSALPEESYSIASQCGLPPITIPTRPADTPPYTALDESTGLHVTGTAQDIDLTTYRLKVTGLVDNPLELTYEDLRCMPKITATPTLICEGYFVDVAMWSGVPMSYLLEQAGVQDGARNVVMISADNYKTTISLSEARRPQNFLAYEWEGQPIPVLHGFPLRAVLPDLTGYNWAKWVIEIKVT